jgi:polyphosphate kinase 2 PPK2
MLSSTSTAHAPWFIVPADHKWFTRLVVADAIVDAVSRLDLKYPKLSPAQQAGLAEARKRLQE